jgi:heterodisulfide reductase subunit C
MHENNRSLSTLDNPKGSRIDCLPESEEAAAKDADQYSENKQALKLPISNEVDTAGLLAEAVMDRSGQNLMACYQCRRCAAGCPVGEETGYVTPDRLIRMIILGDREAALNNELVWKCVSCYTCGERCPNGIHTVKINETLKKMASEARLEPIEPKVAHFHSAFISSAISTGRMNEIMFMTMYAIKNSFKSAIRMNFKTIYSDLIELAKFGLSMTLRKRMHFGFQSSKGRNEIKRLYKKAKT